MIANVSDTIENMLHFQHVKADLFEECMKPFELYDGLTIVFEPIYETGDHAYLSRIAEMLYQVIYVVLDVMRTGVKTVILNGNQKKMYLPNP